MRNGRIYLKYSAPYSFMMTYRMNLISAGSISQGSIPLNTFVYTLHYIMHGLDCYQGRKFFVFRKCIFLTKGFILGKCRISALYLGALSNLTSVQILFVITYKVFIINTGHPFPRLRKRLNVYLNFKIGLILLIQ